MKRLFAHLQVLPIGGKYKRICYEDKVIYADYCEAVRCREKLFESLYQHKSVIAMEIVLLEVLHLAGSYLKFYDDEGQEYTLKNAYKNMAVFSSLDDSILLEVKFLAVYF
jgi:HD superfamily phosphohydrolase